MESIGAGTKIRIPDPVCLGDEIGIDIGMVWKAHIRKRGPSASVNQYVVRSETVLSKPKIECETFIRSIPKDVSSATLKSQVHGSILPVACGDIDVGNIACINGETPKISKRISYIGH